MRGRWSTAKRNSFCMMWSGIPQLQKRRYIISKPVPAPLSLPVTAYTSSGIFQGEIAFNKLAHYTTVRVRAIVWSSQDYSLLVTVSDGLTKFIIFWIISSEKSRIQSKPEIGHAQRI